MNHSSWPELIAVDVEGNGTNPPDLVEVAGMPLRNGQVDTNTAGTWLIKPRRPVTPFATRIHGLTNELLDEQPHWNEIEDEVHSLLGTSWIVAHNAHVDYKALSAHLPHWQPAGVLDTLRLAKATYPDLPTYNLDALIDHLQLDLNAAPAQRHRATFDAYTTALLLLRMAEHYTTWEALMRTAVPPGLPGTISEPTLW